MYRKKCYFALVAHLLKPQFPEKNKTGFSSQWLEKEPIASLIPKGKQKHNCPSYAILHSAVLPLSQEC